MFSCEFCEISKNTFYYRTPLVAASVWNTHKSRSTFQVSWSTSCESVSFISGNIVLDIALQAFYSIHSLLKLNAYLVCPGSYYKLSLNLWTINWLFSELDFYYHHAKCKLFQLIFSWENFSLMDSLCIFSGDSQFKDISAYFMRIIQPKRAQMNN